MIPSPLRASKHEVPEIVHIVLNQIGRLRQSGLLSEKEFDRQLNRLAQEELKPRGLSLQFSDLADGHTQFLITERNGSVCETIEAPMPMSLT